MRNPDPIDPSWFPGCEIRPNLDLVVLTRYGQFTTPTFSHGEKTYNSVDRRSHPSHKLPGTYMMLSLCSPTIINVPAKIN